MDQATAAGAPSHSIYHSSPSKFQPVAFLFARDHTTATFLVPIHLDTRRDDDRATQSDFRPDLQYRSFIPSIQLAARAESTLAPCSASSRLQPCYRANYSARSSSTSITSVIQNLSLRTVIHFSFSKFFDPSLCFAIAFQSLTGLRSLTLDLT